MPRMLGIGTVQAELDGSPDAWLADRVARPFAQAHEEPSEGLDLEEEIVLLYDSYAEPLARYAMGIVGSEELAAEAVQECFLQYVSQRRAGSKAASGPTWFFREVRSQIRREQSRRSREADTTEPENAAYEVIDPASGPEQVYLTGEVRRMAAAVVSPRELDCLLLRSEGLDYEEIATVMKITSGTVGAMLARAVRKLQTIVLKKGN